MGHFVDKTGTRFGLLTVIKRAERVGVGAYWFCICDCGNTSVVSSVHLRKHGTRSCGCLRRRGRFNHGYSRRGHVSPEYNALRNALARCYDEYNKSYANYGGRGIRVYAPWNFRITKRVVDSVTSFVECVGLRPGPEYSLDRIDNNGHYEPGNVRWATKLEQRHNQRKVIRNRDFEAAVEAEVQRRIAARAA